MLTGRVYKKTLFNAIAKVDSESASSDEELFVCGSCFKAKPLSEFNKQSNSPTGHRYSCRECEKKTADKALTQRATELYFSKIYPKYQDTKEYTNEEIVELLGFSFTYVRRIMVKLYELGFVECRVVSKIKVYRNKPQSLGN